MKRIILLFGIAVSLIAATNVFSQATEGVIEYQVKIDQHRRIPKERENMKAMIPEFRLEKQQLFFKDGESLYKRVEEDSEEDMASNTNGGSAGPRMVIRTPKLEVFTELNNQTRLTKQEFMGKEYLVCDSLKIAPWKFGTETKTIQGYECKQAYYTDDSRPENKREITAWFTDKLTPFLGPETFNTLPGTVLAIDINNGERVIVAQSIQVRPLRKNELKKPSDGTKMTQPEFRAMVEEQLKKNGGNSFIIRN